MPARVRAWVVKWRVLLKAVTPDFLAARGCYFGPKIFRFCGSGPSGSTGNATSLNWRMDLYEYERVGRDLRSFSGAWRRVVAPLRPTFLGNGGRSPFKILVGSFFLKWCQDFYHLSCIGFSSWTYALLVYFGCGRSVRAAPEFRVVGHEVDDEPQGRHFR